LEIGDVDSGRHIGNLKKTQYLSNGLSDLHTIRSDDVERVSEPDRPLKFDLLKIQDGGRPQFLKKNIKS